MGRVDRFCILMTCVCASVIPNGSDQQLRRAGHRLKTVELKM